MARQARRKAASDMPEWRFSQCFGEKDADEEFSEADVLSAVEFDETGQFLATGDKGGRIVVFERAESKTSSKGAGRGAGRRRNTCEYRFFTEFQSHEAEFDYLKSLEIEEKINQIRWCKSSNSALFLLSTNDKTIKLWKVFEKKLKIVSSMNLPRGRYGAPTSVKNLKIPTLTCRDTAVCATPRRVYANAHAYHVNSISPCSRVSILDDTRPNFIVVYDADHAFIREIEVYKATHCVGLPLRVYFMMYDNSVEEQQYLTQLKQEKQAFERLIFEKAHLNIPASPGRGNVVAAASAVAPSWGVTVSDTRIGNHIMDSIESSKASGVVVVDMREFRSRLPCLLYQAGFKVIPMTLEVGDYVISPTMCFERKSIPDLYGSFNSGRLFHQVEVMTRCYARPMLLIEFDESKPFSLQHVNDIPSDIVPSNIISKISLLSLHFPTLRIMWSRSPRATVDLIKALKYKQPEPDAEHAASIGTEGNATSSAIVTTVAAPTVKRNDVAMDMLLRLPGLNRGNCGVVIDACPTLADVCNMSQEKMVKLLGPANAAKLYTFLHQKPTALNAHRKV